MSAVVDKVDSVERVIATGHSWHGPGLFRRAIHGARRAPISTLIALLIVGVACGPLLFHRVYAVDGLRLVDLGVYRDAGRSVLIGRPLYSYLTPVPQLLPFTYPPFSAIVAVPLALLPMSVTSVIWTLGSLGVLTWLVLVGFRPFVRRFPGRYRPIVVGVLLSLMVWTEPIRDEFRFGQVGIFLAALCTLDCLLTSTRWPRGALVGLAAAIKLTPAVFIPYLWLSGRRRAAVVAMSWFVGAAVVTAIAMPQASRVFWTSAVFDSGRAGDNAGTSNQSLRSVFLRSLPGPVGSALWLASAIVVAVIGFRWARRASVSGGEIRGIAITGLLAVLLSPIAWIHHLSGFMPLMIGAVLGDGRDRKRIASAVFLTVFFTLEIPWWGQTLLGHLHHWLFVARMLQDSYTAGVLLAIFLISRIGPPVVSAVRHVGVTRIVTRIAAR
jgi:alpha-1,2-mannosyltransferase